MKIGRVKVTTVRAVNQDVDSVVQAACHRQRSVQNGVNVPQPSAGMHSAEESVHRWRLKLASFQHLSQAATHHVDVLDTAKLELDVLVKVLVLVALASRPIRHGVDLNKTIDLVHTFISHFTPHHLHNCIIHALRSLWMILKETGLKYLNLKSFTEASDVTQQVRPREVNWPDFLLRDKHKCSFSLKL